MVSKWFAVLIKDGHTTLLPRYGHHDSLSKCFSHNSARFVHSYGI
jgi:hypothetical protein